MAWNLEIHTIDVGQGESSLIIAYDPATNESRSMLIDAGLSSYAKTVHEYITSQLSLLGLPRTVSHILVSHYDGDHSGGIVSLLTADNLYRQCKVLAEAAGAAAYAAALANQTQDHQIAAAAAASVATARGAYDVPGKLASNTAVTAGTNTYGIVVTNQSSKQVASEGVDSGEVTADKNANLNPPLISTSLMRRKVCSNAGIAAGGVNGGDAAARSAAAFTVIFDQLRGTVPEDSRFLTDGLYDKVHIIDIGDTNDIPSNYVNVINGRHLMSGNHVVELPGLTRTRLQNPALGREVLWKSGLVAAPSANAPEVFVVACRKSIWKTPKEKLPIPGTSNSDSIGLILRFNNFFYYTGGDLPSEGEDLVATAVMGNGLPKPTQQNPKNTYPKPNCIACFKCGHHGSNHSTSLNFLKLIEPRAAFISSGYKVFKDEILPAQKLIDRLNADTNVLYFYLTNCKVETIGVPASLGQDQGTVLGNKSRVCGDNDDNNLLVGRRRGNIKLTISQNESTGVVPATFHVEYFDVDEKDPITKNPIGVQIEDITF